MKNFIWLASYPKSGNTMLRLFLSSYFFTSNGILENFDILKNIISLNKYSLLRKTNKFPDIKILIKNPELISNYWISTQEYIERKHDKEIFFIKTHNANINYKNNDFTNSHFTKSFLYVVRDPRSLVVSMMPHFNFKTFDEAKLFLTSNHACTSVKEDLLPEIMLSWKSHYLSWKNFHLQNTNLGLILKFEDLVTDTENTLYKALVFLCKKINQNIDLKKFNNCLKSIDFQNLQNFETKFSFPEIENKKQKFFRKGIINEWNDKVPQEIIYEIEKTFNKEMKELKYL